MLTRPTLKAPRPNNVVQSIERVSIILDVLSKYPQGLSLGHVSGETGLNKGTAHRLLSSLAFLDYVRQDAETKKYCLGFKLVELGNRLLSQIDLRTEARPFLMELAERTKETVHLVILDRFEVLYVDKVEAVAQPTGLRMVSLLGSRIPAHCSAVGKVLLAALPEESVKEIAKKRAFPRRTKNTITDPAKLLEHLKHVKKKGFALDDEENEIGVRCVGAPIHDQRGDVIAAISISVPAIRIETLVLRTTFRDLVVQTALNISEKLGYQRE
jgi:IclR family transcriptional regulator, KDG regulon repressor